MTVLSAFGRHRRRPALAAIILVAGALLAGGARPARGQDVGERLTPSAGYYAAFGAFYEGEYKDALKMFQKEGRGAIKTTQSHWIDSICYHTMVGECYYQMGDLPKALEHYTSALKLFNAFSGWMIRVQFPARVTAAGPGAYKAVPWGASQRNARLGRYPRKMSIAQGRINNNPQFQRGGVVQPAMLFPIQVQEIVRATTLAIRRRAELMGPVCPHDPVTDELITKLSRRPGPPNHWSECWVDVQLGLALLAGGKEEQALPFLNRSLLAAGEYDHPMTCIALLELGRLALAKGQYAPAARLLEEATYSAAAYGDCGVLEEAFRYATIAHMLGGGRGICPLLEPAARWAKVKDLRQLRASLLLLGAENHAFVGQTAQAAALLDEAKLAVGRRTMGAGRIGARYSYLSALVLFQQKKIPAGNEALGAAMGYMKHGSHWLFQIGLADGLYTGGRASPRVAMDLYTGVLRDPQAADWKLQPIESLAVLVTPHAIPMEHWFEVALLRKEHETALEISERIRRHRFFSSLAFGGRLESLRWILEAPPEVLPQLAQLQRQNLLAQHPVYDNLAQQARALRNQLRGMPLVPGDQEAQQQQAKLLEQLGAVSALQEALLREVALRREPASLVFPPLKTTKEILEGLPKGQALLVFFATSRATYGFLLADQRYTYWQLRSSPLVLAKQLQAMLREMGHFEQNRELSVKDLANSKWKQPAQKLLELLLEGSRADLAQIEELAIVPDGLLWYVPFEALQQKAGENLEPLILRLRVRYAPTASLAIADGRARRPTGNAAVVAGKLFPRDDPSVAQAAFEQLARVVPGAVALRGPLPGPTSVYATLFDRLVVLDDILVEAGPYGWAPVQIERNKPGNTLSDWLSLPWGGPDVVVLPGFHTAAEASLKRIDRAAPGMEVFLSVCGLMADGARTLLISRWRTGGRNSFDLVREFTQELPHASPADAWQRAVLLTAGSPLDVGAEPRIKRADESQSPPRANHPFFWAGYMLVDSGVPPHKPDPKPAAKPAVPAPKQP